MKQLNSREARSNAFFETPDFTTIDLNDSSSMAIDGTNAVDTFDNFLKPTTSRPSGAANTDYFEQGNKIANKLFKLHDLSLVL